MAKYNEFEIRALIEMGYLKKNGEPKTQFIKDETFKENGRLNSKSASYVDITNVMEKLCLKYKIEALEEKVSEQKERIRELEKELKSKKS